MSIAGGRSSTADFGAYPVSRALDRLKAAFPAWLITADDGGKWVLFTARRPGLCLTQATEQAMDAELRRWEMR
jgi:hypothetical protein